MSREGQASLSALSKELGINPKTVAKWRKRATVEDMKTGPKEPRSTVLNEAEEAAVVAFRPRIDGIAVPRLLGELDAPSRQIALQSPAGQWLSVRMVWT